MIYNYKGKTKIFEGDKWVPVQTGQEKAIVDVEELPRITPLKVNPNVFYRTPDSKLYTLNVETNQFDEVGSSGGGEGGSAQVFVDVKELPTNPDENVIYRLNEKIQDIYVNGVIVDSAQGAPVNKYFVDELPQNPEPIFVTTDSGALESLNIYICNNNIFGWGNLEDPTSEDTYIWYDASSNEDFFTVLQHVFYVNGFLFVDVLPEQYDEHIGYVVLNGVGDVKYYNYKQGTLNELQVKDNNVKVYGKPAFYAGSREGGGNTLFKLTESQANEILTNGAISYDVGIGVVNITQLMEDYYYGTVFVVECAAGDSFIDGQFRRMVDYEGDSDAITLTLIEGSGFVVTASYPYVK